MSGGRSMDEALQELSRAVWELRERMEREMGEGETRGRQHTLEELRATAGKLFRVEGLAETGNVLTMVQSLRQRVEEQQDASRAQRQEQLEERVKEGWAEGERHWKAQLQEALALQADELEARLRAEHTRETVRQRELAEQERLTQQKASEARWQEREQALEERHAATLKDLAQQHQEEERQRKTREEAREQEREERLAERRRALERTFEAKQEALQSERDALHQQARLQTAQSEERAHESQLQLKDLQRTLASVAKERDAERTKATAARVQA